MKILRFVCAPSRMASSTLASHKPGVHEMASCQKVLHGRPAGACLERKIEASRIVLVGAGGWIGNSPFPSVLCFGGISDEGLKERIRAERKGRRGRVVRGEGKRLGVLASIQNSEAVEHEQSSIWLPYTIDGRSPAITYLHTHAPHQHI
jgi:hypothetical protein